LEQFERFEQLERLKLDIYMKALHKLKEISKKLACYGIQDAEKEAELIIRESLGINLVDLYKDNPQLGEKQITSLDNIVNRRQRREPIQYILGYCDFMGLKILVGQGVLIPRPETELMAEYAIKTVTEKYKNLSLNILDLCTGSGCLALALAKALPDSQVYGTDISELALNYAKKNAKINEISNVKFLTGNLFEPLKQDMSFDLIICNPPYVRTEDIKSLEPEIRDWEPLNALDGGTDGLDYYRKIIPDARNFFNNNGILMLELGAGCASSVAHIMENAGYTEIKIQKDYAGVERIIQARWIR
jgi:release factor glutamine methyltransferase